MDALVGSPETSDLTCAILRAFPRVRFETIALLAGSPRPFLLAEFREISLRSARVCCDLAPRSVRSQGPSCDSGP